jgi:hypothetical protein
MLLQNDIFETALFPLSSLYQSVQVCDIGLVMFTVVVIKGFSGNDLSKGSLIIGQRREGKAHGIIYY